MQKIEGIRKNTKYLTIAKSPKPGVRDKNLTFSGKKSPVVSRHKSPSNFIRKNQKSKTYNMGNVSLPFTSMVRSSVKTFQNPEFRDYMEDIPVTIHGYLKETTKHLFCIFDGHGGDASAKICSVFFPDMFGRLLKEFSSNIESCLKKTFAKMDIETKKKNCITVGNTATVVYICNKLLFCANVGDSSCVLVSKDGAKMISVDHKCTEPSEIKRMTAAGGHVFDERLEGQLAISRAIGDHDLKDKGLIAEPHIYKTLITENDRFCVLASDGIWDVMNEKDIYEICKGENNTDILVEKIVNEAIERGSEDNISCIVVTFNNNK